MSDSEMEALLSLLSRLTISPDATPVLQDLKTSLVKTEPAVLARVSKSPYFRGLFDCLNTSDQEQVVLATNVLEDILKAGDPREMLELHWMDFQRALDHPNETILKCVLRQLQRCSGASLQPHTPLLLSAVRLIGSDSVSVAAEASRLVGNVGKGSDGHRLLFSDPVFQTLQELCRRSDIVRFRVYEVAVSVAVGSEEGLHVVLQSGFLKSLVEEAYKGDVLSQLNALELLSTLSLVPHGLSILHDMGFMDKLEYMISMYGSNPMDSFIIPGVVKLFGRLAHQWPQDILSRYKTFSKALFALVDSSDPTIAAVAVDTVAHIATSSEGKKALASREEEMQQCLRRLGQDAASPQAEIRIRALNNMAKLLHVEEDFDDSAITQSWFSQLHSTPFDLLVKLCKLPFIDVRCAALEVFTCLSSQRWGQHLINNTPGVIEYLLNRSTESQKEGKQAKFEVVHALVTSSSAINVFDGATLAKFRVYDREGPFFVSTETQVAVEGS